MGVGESRGYSLPLKRIMLTATRGCELRLLMELNTTDMAVTLEMSPMMDILCLMESSSRIILQIPDCSSMAKQLNQFRSWVVARTRLISSVDTIILR